MPYTYGNPAGCAPEVPEDLSAQARLMKVQEQLDKEIVLKKRQVTYIWNGVIGSYLETAGTDLAYEFEVNEFQPPFTYLGDKTASIFVQNGFAVWFRGYGGNFRLLAVPITEEVRDSVWGEYVDAYWRANGIPSDQTIIAVSKKLPCHWMLDSGLVNPEILADVFDLDWHVPDYLQSGRKYLADSCSEAYRVAQEEIGYWDATSMCGPLTWQILHDSNSFPYRIGNYDSDARLFINANPRYWGARPWTGFDPETYDLVVRTKEPMAGYDFENKGNLHPGDVLFSYGSPDKWSKGGGNFSHIFLVAGTNENESRLAVSNMVKNHRGEKDCYISEVELYTPGDPINGVIRHEWNDHGYGSTGKYGFDIFRWKWITYHQEGQSVNYEVRWGETIETIAFDWKISPERVIEVNHFPNDVQLNPGQIIQLPSPTD
jgi:hypothetical protein